MDRPRSSASLQPNICSAAAFARTMRDSASTTTSASAALSTRPARSASATRGWSAAPCCVARMTRRDARNEPARGREEETSRSADGAPRAHGSRAFAMFPGVSLLVAVETTSRVTGVALFEDGVLVASVEREGLGDIVLPLVDELLRGRGLRARDVARWAVDVGPGSFTGVRVGLSTVKGIAFATGAEVVAVSSFDAVDREAVVILEAGKGEVYFRFPGEAPGHAPLETVKRRLEGLRVVGPGVPPRAEGVGRVALGRPADDVDRIEPLYVRAPDLTKPSPR